MHTETGIPDTVSDAPESTEAAGAPLRAEQASGRPGVPTDPQKPSQGLPVPLNEVDEAHASPAPRPWTPDRVNADGGTTITMKRACNGCGTRLGDVTDQEMACGINGLPLPDVRRECPTCGPTAPEPRCLPVRTVDGDPDCLDQDCDHDTALDSDYCDEVTDHVICLTHSTISRDGAITNAQPWPCTHTAVTA